MCATAGTLARGQAPIPARILASTTGEVVNSGDRGGFSQGEVLGICLPLRAAIFSHTPQRAYRHLHACWHNALSLSCGLL